MSDTDPPTLTQFTAGDLVISLSGDGANTGTYGDNQASPMVLDELTTTGTVVAQLVLPQTTTVVNGVTEYAISSEYGSSSEGSLQLSANGESLVIAGYGINAATFNAGGAAVYGNAALAQSTSVPGGEFTAVSRVIADISYNGVVDTSTALYNVFNLNNPRSVATVNGTVFYISGQGVKGDTTQGVFLAHDGADTATAIDTSTDTRTLQIYNGELYVSRDSTQGTGGEISTYGSTLPTSATTPTVLPGIAESITLTAAQANGIDNADIGSTVNLSPENYFFASPTVLYVADGGDPKEGGLGDGGLQKWVLTDGTWTLEYTLTSGLNLVADTGSSGTTGLIGLTGTVTAGGIVELFATNSTLGDLDQTYVYSISDTLSSTTGAGESFTTVYTAPADTNVRGISFAPVSAATTTSVTSVTSGVTSSGVVVTSGSSLIVANGGTTVGATIMSGGSATVSSGGVDSGTDIAQGGTETLSGTATGDFVGGLQFVSSGNSVVNNETVLNGGTVELFKAGIVANSPTVESGGSLLINGGITVNNLVIDGGLVELQSPKVILDESVLFDGAGTIEVMSNTAAMSSGVSYGDQAVISGFGAGDVIDFTATTSVGKAGSAALLSTTTSGGNTVATVSATVSGTIYTETYIFAGSIGTDLHLSSDGNGGEEITFSAPPPISTTISNGVSSGGLTVTSGSFLDVLSGGTVTATTVESTGMETVEIGGVDSNTTILAGGNQDVFGTATGDQVFGTQLISAGGGSSASVAVVNGDTVFNGGVVDMFLKGAVTNNLTVMSGGTFNINGSATGSNTVIEAGGTVDLESGKATLGGSLTFSGAGTLEITGATSAGNGEIAVISGFGSGAMIDYTLIGPGATLSTTVSGGNTVALVTSGGTTQSATFAGNIGANLALTSDGHGGEEITYSASSSTSSSTPPPTLTAFTKGDLVISLSGDGADTGTYGDNQASPAVLQELTTTGTIVGQLVLPQQTTVVNGVTEYAFSSEYGSSSEGTLQLSADGQSIVIGGYGINAATYNAGGAAVYGNAALAQTTSVPGGEFTPVARVIADISYNAVIDTSTALYNVFNTNNPRSVATVNGTSFYISGQGVSGDTTQGLFLTRDGADSATAIDNSTDVRSVEIVNGQLYTSRDSKQLPTGGEISNYGSTLPTSATTPTSLPGISGSVTLTAGQENGINNADVGSAVYLSPENFFFASPTVLYVADGGDPKAGGLGDGGLQKWVLTDGTWTLEYTLTSGLNLVSDTGSSGTTGLIGLTGTVTAGGVVELFATNSTLGDTDQTYLYGITDTLSATTNTGSSFAVLETAPADTNIRGVVFAPTSAATTISVTSVTSGVTSGGVVVTSGSSLIVANGGTATTATIMSGGSAVISAGGVNSGSDIAQGGTETLLGSATGDFVGGTQLVTGATAAVSNETILNGGTVELLTGGAVVNGVTVGAVGTLVIGANVTVDNATISGAVLGSTVSSGGVVDLASPQAVLAGVLTLSGPGIIEVTANIASGFGDLATISGFMSGNVIDLTSATAIGAAGPPQTLSVTTSGGDTVATVSGGGSSETFIFAGTTIGSFLSLQSDGNGGEEIVFAASTTSSAPVISVANGVTSTGLVISVGTTVDVLSGGTISSTTLLSGGSASVAAGGIDSSTSISAGGIETLVGSATRDSVAGTQLDSGSVVSDTILAGGSVTVETGATDSGSVISAGGTETVSGSAVGDQVFGIQENVVSAAVVSNEIVFNGGAVELLIAGAIANGVTADAGGTILINGRGTLEAGVLNGGTLLLELAKATIGNGNGSIIGSTLSWTSGAVLEETTTISAMSSGTYFGDQAVNLGFAGGDAIVFAAATSVGAAGTSATLNVTTSGGDTVAVVSGKGSVQSFTFSGTTLAGALSLVVSGGNVELVACFAEGTRIATTDGEVAVQDLKVDDLLPTLLGGDTAPIIWIGQREVDCTRHPKPQQVWPVRIAAGAFGPGLPHTDLFLSPDHAVYVGEVLIPVKRLINGSTIVQVPMDRVTYYHVELPRHDVVLAQGLPAESYLDMMDRSDFANGPGPMKLYPDFSSRMWDAFGCAPLVLTGPELEAARRLVRQCAVTQAAA